MDDELYTQLEQHYAVLVKEAGRIERLLIPERKRRRNVATTTTPVVGAVGRTVSDVVKAGV
jgi:hypothetical protein